MNVSREKMVEVVKHSVSLAEVCRRLNLPQNGNSYKKLRRFFEEFRIDTSHFSQKAVIDKFVKKYDTVVKRCPVCGTEFTTQQGHIREKMTCSYSCSNTFFKEERNASKRTHYRTICFSKWDKKCAVCGYDRIVHVHHLDGDKKNNAVENLIPLCSNHHQELHSKKYSKEVRTVLKQKYGVDSITLVGFTKTHP